MQVLPKTVSRLLEPLNALPPKPLVGLKVNGRKPLSVAGVDNGGEDHDCSNAYVFQEVAGLRGHRVICLQRAGWIK